MEKMKDLLATLSKYMAEHNIPFYSPRYNGHMNADLSLPGTLGYMVCSFLVVSSHGADYVVR